MARNQNNDDGASLFASGVLGLLLGAAANGLSSEDKAALDEFKANKILFSKFKSLLPNFENYLKNKSLIDYEVAQYSEKAKIRNQLLKIVSDFGIQDNVELKRYIEEPGALIFNGFFRAGAIISLINLETILRKKIEGKRLLDIIDNAKAAGWIDEKDRNYLHGLRGDRNDLAHEVPANYSQSDAIHIFMLSLKIVAKIYSTASLKSDPS